MDKTELRTTLAEALQELYDLEAFTTMMEYGQGELRVLLYLHTHDETEVYPHVLSDSLYVTRQRITSILSSLRKKGYVCMEMSASDRRKMRVALTDSGRSYIAAKITETEIYFDALIGGLGEQNIHEMIRLVQLSSGQLKQFSE